MSRRVLAPILALLLVGATVAPPLLDAEEDVHTAQFEAEHDPSACAPLHDHKACSQLAKTLGQVALGWKTIRLPQAIIRGERPPAAPVGLLPHVSLLPPPRGPPTSFS